jgi:hypothetical protein
MTRTGLDNGALTRVGRVEWDHADVDLIKIMRLDWTALVFEVDRVGRIHASTADEEQWDWIG